MNLQPIRQNLGKIDQEAGQVLEFLQDKQLEDQELSSQEDDLIEALNDIQFKITTIQEIQKWI